MHVCRCPLAHAVLLGESMVQSCALWDSGFVGKRPSRQPRLRWQRHRSLEVVNLGPAASPSLDFSALISHPSNLTKGRHSHDIKQTQIGFLEDAINCIGMCDTCDVAMQP